MVFLRLSERVDDYSQMAHMNKLFRNSKSRWRSAAASA